MSKYVVLYGDKKPEDNICIKNMFENTKQIKLGWTELDYNDNMKIIEEVVGKGINQIIISGFEIGWDKLVKSIKQKYPNIKIKVICNTQDSLLYYEYERENFFRLLELSKENIIYDIAFLRKGQYETYKSLGYNCSYLTENYILKEKVEIEKTKNNKLQLGIYPLNYTWDKNIFNQLCIAKFLNDCNLNYNCLDVRMQEFLNTMEISNIPIKIENIDDKNIMKELIKNDVIVTASFTEYFHPIFLMSMELGIPCLIGNNSDFFENNDELKEYVVTSAEDNAIVNSKMIEEILKNKEKIIELYKNWKKEYNQKAQANIENFIEK